jgi:putative spermidine/putrescine transport system permease protein
MKNRSSQKTIVNEIRGNVFGKWRLARGFHVLMLLPTFVVILLTVIFPLVLVLNDSFIDRKGNYSLFQYIETFTNRYFLLSLGYTVMIGLGVAFVSIIISLPISYFLARNEKLRNFMLGIVTVTRMLPFFVLGYTMILLFAPQTGLINKIFYWNLGLFNEPLNILFSWQSLCFALLYLRTVMTIAMLTGIIQEINPNLETAALSMGASRFTAFREIILPLCTSGIIAALSLAFAENIAAFSIPLMLGGKGLPMVSLLIRQTLLFIPDRNLASAYAMVVSIVSLVCVMFSNQIVKRGTKI